MAYEHFTCFVHGSFTRELPWSLMDFLAILFDEQPPKGFMFSTFTDSEMMAHIVHTAGAFKSVGEARRNGWNIPVPDGYSYHVIGKRRLGLAILNRFDGMYDYACSYKFCRCGNGKGIPPNKQYPMPIPGATTLCPFDQTSYCQELHEVPT